MEFVVYLNYRGVPIDSVASANGAIAKDDRRIEYSSIRCHPASEPAPGALVIVLPDDEASLAEALVFRERQQLLFSYKPRPHWLYPLVRLWRSGRRSIRFSLKEISVSTLTASDYNETRADRWMDASVTVWQ
jgi:hypothetical protein